MYSRLAVLFLLTIGLLVPGFVRGQVSGTGPSIGIKGGVRSNPSSVGHPSLVFKGVQFQQGGKLTEIDPGTPVMVWFDGNQIAIRSGPGGNMQEVARFVNVPVGDNGESIESVIRRMKANRPKVPDVCLDSLIVKCGTQVNLFWGDIYSVDQQVSSSKNATGQPLREFYHNTSICISHGWIFDCAHHTWTLRMSIQHGDQSVASEDYFNGYSDIATAQVKTDCNKPKKH